MSTLLDRLAEELAEDAVAQAKRANDPEIIETVAKSLADTSTTFKDTFLTCVRYIQAAERARLTLPDPTPRGSDQAQSAPAPVATPPAVAAIGKGSDAPEEGTPDNDAAASNAPADGDYAEVEYLEEEKPASIKTPVRPRLGAGGTSLPAGQAETPSVEPEITGPRRRNH